MKEATIFVGIDIAKKSLQLACTELSLPAVISHDRAGIKGLINRLKKYREQTLIVCEATGGLETQLVDWLQEAELAVSVISPSQGRHFAKADQQWAKTDKIDAAILAQFARRMKPVPKAKSDPKVRQLAALVARRADLVQMRSAEHNRLEQSAERLVIEDLKGSLKSLAAKIKRFDQQIASLIGGDAGLAQKFKLLCSVQGVGQQVASTLLATLPELGTLGPNQVAHLIGVAPLNWDSGRRRGKRLIYGGRRFARRSLYMAALTAARHNRVLAPFYRRLLQRGKAPKVALVALMRKLIIYLNRLLQPLGQS